ncbi:hypothetical protein [Kibdelosporangium aridum]|uniref:hypothetical protein n=1 Tax=Kibdelosporangium aridum TaxID=2030 RepID=UPI0035EC7A0F
MGPAAELAAALVNIDRGAEDTVELIGQIVPKYHRSAEAITPESAAQILAWADRLSPVFGQADLDRLVDTVNGLLADSASRPYISPGMTGGTRTSITRTSTTTSSRG